MKKNKGISLISLTITVIVLLIIAGVSIGGAITGNKNSESNIKKSELEMVQHAVAERYTKYKLTKDSTLLKGKIIVPSSTMVGGPNWRLSQEEIGSNVEKKYYQLDKSELKEIGITADVTDTYIVNYYTGEVYNSTNPQTLNGEMLYTYIK